MSSHHGPTLRHYFGVFFALLFLTAATVWVASIDLGAWNTPVALMIAGLKASLVLLYFMHVRWSSRLTWIFIAGSLLWLLVLIAFTMSDYLSRDWLVIYGA